MKITRVAAAHLRVPLPARGRVSLTAPAPPAGPDAVDLLTAHVETDAGLTGLGFTYVVGPGAAAVKGLLEGELAALLVGEDPHDTDRHFARVESRFRPAGFAGLAARAYAALDIALWDLKGKAAGLPLYRILCNARPAAPFFHSDVATLGRDADEAIKLAKPLLKRGAMGLRVEVGGGDVQGDADRVREVSEGLGDAGWVAVAAGGRYDLTTAAAMSHFFEDIGIDLFEDPLPAADAPGYARLAALLEVPLAVGTHFDTPADFYRVIREGVVRTVRPDPVRLGGITPVLKVAAVAEAFQAAVVPVRLTEVGVHLGCGLPAVPHVDAVGWFADVFAGGPTVEGGKLVPPAGAGLGVTLKDGAAERFGA